MKDPEEQKRLNSMKFWPSTKFFATYQWRDLKRRKFHFCLAFCSVFFIVLATLVVTTIVSKGPYIFLELAQDSHGEIDAFISPRDSSTFINFTSTKSMLEDLRGQGASYDLSPRKVFSSVIATKKTPEEPLVTNGLTLIALDT